MAHKSSMWTTPLLAIYALMRVIHVIGHLNTFTKSTKDSTFHNPHTD